MKALVISDTHGNLDLVAEAGRLALRRGAGLVLHLGDDLEDAAALPALGLQVRGVQGVYHPEYRLADTPNRLLVRLEEVPLLLTHCRVCHPNDRPEDEEPAQLARRLSAAAVLYGHTHVPSIDEEDGLLWVNPGHLRPQDNRGWPPTVALIEANGGQLAVRIEELHTGLEFFSWPKK